MNKPIKPTPPPLRMIREGGNGKLMKILDIFTWGMIILNLIGWFAFILWIILSGLK